MAFDACDLQSDGQLAGDAGRIVWRAWSVVLAMIGQQAGNLHLGDGTWNRRKFRHSLGYPFRQRLRLFEPLKYARITQRFAFAFNSAAIRRCPAGDIPATARMMSASASLSASR